VTLDCQACGACCLGRVLVGNDPVPDLLAPHKVGRFIDPQGGRCAALLGTVGASVSCAVYEARPRKCVMFENDGDKCHELREAHLD